MSLLRHVCLITVLAVALASLPVAAASHTWSGATSGNWSVAGNWSAGGAPANSETNVDLVFPNAQANMGTMVNDLANLGVTSITFHDTAYQVSGNAISFAGTIAVDNGTLYGAPRISFDIALTGDATLQVPGNPDYWLDIHGIVSGPHDVTVQIPSPFIGTPLVQLFGANSYTGTTTVDGAYLEVDHPSALGGSGTGTVVTNGTLKVLNTVVAGEPLSVGGGGQNGNGAFQVYGSTWTGPVTLTSATSFVADNGATISGVISGAFPITFGVFSSTLTLTQNNSYAGPGTISFGTVIVNGIQPASSWVIGGFSTPRSVLGGGGTLGAISMGGGANAKVVDPGPAASPGVLVTGDLSLNDAANGNHGVLHADLLGTTSGQFDQVNVAGTVDVTGAALEVAPGPALAVGNTFVVVNNDGADAVTGRFAGLPNSGDTFVAGGRTFSIDYAGGDGNDVVLTVASLTPVSLQRYTAE